MATLRDFCNPMRRFKFVFLGSQCGELCRYARVQEVHMFGQNSFATCNVKMHYVTLVFARSLKVHFVTPTFADDIPGTVAATAPKQKLIERGASPCAIDFLT